MGDAAIMKGMYDDTQDKVFLKRSIKLIEETVKATNLLEFQNINSFNGNVCKYSYLVGYTGILQTLQTVLMNCSNKSEEKILIR